MIISLSERQKTILETAKSGGPVTGEQLAEKLLSERRGNRKRTRKSFKKSWNIKRKTGGSSYVFFTMDSTFGRIFRMERLF